MVSGFRRGVSEICSLFVFQAAWKASFVFTQLKMLVPKRRYKTSILSCVKYGKTANLRAVMFETDPVNRKWLY